MTIHKFQLLFTIALSHGQLCIWECSVKVEDLVLKDVNSEPEVITKKKGKLKEDDDDDDIDTEKALEKTHKELEKSLTNASFIEGVDEVGA